MAKVIKSISEPWDVQQPFLETGFNQAQNLYNNPYFYQQFPYSTVAPFSQQQTQGLQDITRIAGSNRPDVNTYARNEAMRTLGGKYLNAGSNPYLQAMYGDAKRDFLSPVNTAAEGMGRTGSGLHAQAAADALMGAQDASFGQHYENERGRMMQMMGMAPQIADTAYADPRMLLAAGGQIQNQGQAEVNDAFRRFQYGQQRPWDMLGNYMGTVGGQNWGSSNSQTQPSANPFTSALGGALGGAQFGSLIPGIGPLLGGLGGGLLGGLGSLF